MMKRIGFVAMCLGAWLGASAEPGNEKPDTGDVKVIAEPAVAADAPKPDGPATVEATEPKAEVEAATDSIDLALIPLTCSQCKGGYALYLMPPINPVGLKHEKLLQDATLILSDIQPRDAGKHELIQWDWSARRCSTNSFGQVIFADKDELARHAESSQAANTCFFPYLRYDRAILLTPSGLDWGSGLSPPQLQEFFAGKTFHFRRSAPGETRVCPYNMPGNMPNNRPTPSMSDVSVQKMPVGRVKVFAANELNGISRVQLNDHVVYSHAQEVVRIYGLGSTYHGPMRVGEHFIGFWHRLDSGKVLLTLPGDDPANPRRESVEIQLHGASPSFELDGKRYIGQPEGKPQGKADGC